jgi:hypothetical protein
MVRSLRRESSYGKFDGLHALDRAGIDGQRDGARRLSDVQVTNGTESLALEVVQTELAGLLMVLIPDALLDLGIRQVDRNTVKIENPSGVILVSHPPKHVLDCGFIGSNVEGLVELPPNNPLG